MTAVAIIGAGAAGLITARFLQSEGFEVTLFEKGLALGGQWSGVRDTSSVWDAMRTNTSHITTAFSDLSYPAGTPVYPAASQVGDYLRAYADLFSLTSRVRFSSTVQLAERHSDGKWHIVSRDQEEVFDKVVFSTGMYQAPSSPTIRGATSFSGSGGLCHARDYAASHRFRGLRVLVAGCGVSSLEIASDLAMGGATRVFSSFRRQRYILQKFISGAPTDNLVFTRYAALAEESLPLTEVADAFQGVLLTASGSPEQYGALRPRASLLEAGVAQSQHYLPLVAEGRIEAKPWIEEIDGQRIIFSDGSVEEVDAVVWATGYSLHLPYLSVELQKTLGLQQGRLDLYRRTFHPAAPSAAFIGLFGVLGPYFPVLELQARWLAYSWSGARPCPSPEEMASGIKESILIPMQLAALMFARKAGVEPELAAWPDLQAALLFGPLSAVSFRLSGRDSLPEAPARVAADASRFGAIRQAELNLIQREQLHRLAAVRKDRQFTRLIDQLAARELQCQ